MSDNDPSQPDAMDALVSQLLACGGALSQMVGRMQEYEASGLSSPDAPPVLEVAHTLIRGVIAELPERHTEQEIGVSADIIEQVTTAICENIFFVPPSEIRRARNGARPANSRKRAPRPRGQRRR